MDQFELEAFERELAAWRRRVARVAPAPALPQALCDELQAAIDEVDAVRTLVRAHVPISGERVRRHFARLRGLWDYLQLEHAGVDEPAQAP
jgi:hypothetical protein